MIKNQEIILDQLKEMFNLGLGKASQEIYSIVKKQVNLDVPSAKIIKKEEIFKLVNIEPETNVTVVLHNFSGSFNGQAALIFVDPKSIQLVGYILNEDSFSDEMSELEEDVLSDFSSIIVNGVLEAISGLLNIYISSSLPVCVKEKFFNSDQVWFDRDLFKQSFPGDEIMYVEIDFTFNGTNLDGQLVFIQRLENLSSFLGSVSDYLSKEGILED